MTTVPVEPPGWLIIVIFGVLLASSMWLFSKIWSVVYDWLVNMFCEKEID